MLTASESYLHLGPHLMTTKELNVMYAHIYVEAHISETYITVWAKGKKENTTLAVSVSPLDIKSSFKKVYDGKFRRFTNAAVFSS